MDQAKIKEYQHRLEKERGLLIGEIKQHEKPVNVGSDFEDPDEETDKSEEIGNQLAMAEDLRSRLNEVNDALEKIGRGKYGICENCGKEIDTGTLDVAPESRLCKHCKMQKERQKKI